MPDKSHFAKKYADRISEAVDQDGLYVAKGYIKSAKDFNRSELGKVLREIGHEVEGLTYETTHKPISEGDKQLIADEIARLLEWDKPLTLRMLIKGGSVDSLLTMSQEMESLFMAVKK